MMILRIDVRWLGRIWTDSLQGILVTTNVFDGYFKAVAYMPRCLGVHLSSSLIRSVSMPLAVVQGTSSYS